LPYVVLEAAAAGKALVATRVGGIAEIFGPMAEALITPDSVSALVNALHGMAEAEARIAPLRARIVEGFSVDSMVDSVLASYRQALAARAGQPVGAKRSSPQAS
jgi:glycosyltransferase involved in cell wall biosynthesis